MTSPVPRRRRRSSFHRLVSQGWVPDQHGAWPMATVPIILGTAIGGFRWANVLLLLAWVCGFLFFNAATMALKSPRRARYRNALVTWAGLTAVFGIATLVIAPRLMWWAPLFAPLVLIAFWEAWHRRERSLAARMSSVVACGLTCAVAFDLATDTIRPGGWWPWRDGPGWDPSWIMPNDPSVVIAFPMLDWTHAWVVTGLITAYFIGTVPYVRSLIRARGDTRWIAGSVIWHVIGLGLAWWAFQEGEVSWAVPASWILLLARSAVVPWDQARRGPWPAKAIGLSEMAVCILVAVCLLIPS